jgi:phage baseplate assembly protein W
MLINRPTYSFNPQDIGQKRGIGISVLFNSNDIFTQTYTTKDQVKSNLINYILTNKGERLYDPTFGGDLKAMLFDPDTTFDSISAKLENEIYNYIPNIIVDSIDLKKYSDANLVNIIINYSINNQTDQLSINVNQ